ncbi:MAG TPA: permease prefix domain 1-containing protein [Streptosporangiaceae bacterium]|nr:permease prefix domain 1-containing protein [Streptosporangiaceae bacterium]
MRAADPVEDYLDRLLLTLGGSPRQVRHTLAEVEAHLHDAVAAGIAAGLPEHEAQAAAVARIGPVHAVTGRIAAFSRPSAALIRRTALAGSLVGGVALVAVGVSGAISWLLAIAGGGTFLTAPFPPGSYTRADCARWLAADPAAHSCVRAMTDDHTGEVILGSFAAGILGLAVLAAFWWMRRRWQDRSTLTALPVGSAEAAGVILAGLVTVVTLGTGIDAELVQRGVGAGRPFSLAIAALAAAVYFAIRLRRMVRLRAA